MDDDGTQIADLINKIDASQNNNGSGSSTFCSEQGLGTNAAISDSGSTNGIPNIGFSMQRACDLLFGVSLYAEPTKTKIIENAYSAMDELSKLCIAKQPLWQPHTKDRYEILNDIEYLRRFGLVDTTLKEIFDLIEIGEPQNLQSFDISQIGNPTFTAIPTALQIEASRDEAFINMSPISIVELLMDMNQWSSAFYTIVSKAAIVGTLVGVEGSYDDKLHVISTELHLPSPVVPTRECYFGRYSKQLSHNQWGVVDISLEKYFPSPTNHFLKRPSGCLITELPSGYSKVVWVEHVEVDYSHLDNDVLSLFTSTLAFGATRWLNSLVRYSEWLQTFKATTLVADKKVHIPQSGRTNFLSLADRMMKTFCANISGTMDKPWMQLAPFAGCTDVRVMVYNNVEDPGKPPGTHVVFTTSLWLELPPTRLFNFLRHPNSRTMWDTLSNRHTIRELAAMLTGENPGNRVSLMQKNNARGKIEIFYLQESYTDSTGSYVVYAPLDQAAVSTIANGTDSDKVMILPSGFSIVPGSVPGEEDHRVTGSFLTVAFNIMESIENRTCIPAESIETIYKIITDTVSSIKGTVLYHNHRDHWMEQ